MRVERKKVLVCNYSVWCNGDKPCEKCQFFNELKIVDLTMLKDEETETGEVCGCS